MLYVLSASIVQPLVGPVPAADEESGDALDSECDEEEEEMMFDYVSASEDTTPPLPSEITESDDSPDESSPAVVADNDALMNEDTDFDWPILESEELLDFAKDEAELAKTRKTGWYLDPDEFPPDQRYPGLYDDPYGPSEEVMRCADSPLDVFLFFMPRGLWIEVARQSTLYHEQHLVERVDRMYEKQRVEGAKTKTQIMEQEAKHEDIEPHELLNVMGLLVARMINPQRRHFYDHWATTAVGAIPAGTFGRYVKRNPFMYILSKLQFTDNADPRAGTDRAWKVRSVVNALQATLLAGCTTPPAISFDKAMIPLHNRHNPTRQYLTNKPHKWGTKLFMTCCATSTYCLR
ncbi:hypothetical protein PC116_g14910 [Phytophthora cactorum]|nr:hypothetical protein PC116_g14910 [Phytophthora cactorum]